MLNKNGERELAYVVEINDIQPIEGADRVELAIVGGWTIMVRKGQFKPGDLAVYFEIDSKVPAKAPFMFLADKHFKVKTQKYFKGNVVSQGLLMAPEDFGWYTAIDDAGKPFMIGEHKVGEFLTKELGVTYAEAEDIFRKGKGPDKYKKMAGRYPALFKNPIIQWLYKKSWGKKLLFTFLGKKKDRSKEWPAWVVKTDEERVQNMPYILKDKSPWIATEKIDGTSTTATLKRAGRKKKEFYVCSRNVVLTDPNAKSYYDFNVYAEMAEKYKMREALEAIMEKFNLEWVTLQGESYGAGVQKRSYGLEGHDFVGFNLIFSDRGRLPSSDAKRIMAEYGIPWVPIISENFILPDTVEELLTMAAGPSEIDGGMREGLVFRSPDGTKSFKAVSNAYLLKYHG